VPSGNRALNALIRAEIEKRGAVPFRWFMEQALYHPEFGYYTLHRRRIGRKGDYYTNVSVGPGFGKILAGQLVEMWEGAGEPADFTIVEQGAEDGQLALDILNALRSRAAWSRFRYLIVEPLAAKRSAQQQTLSAVRDRVDWAAEIAEARFQWGALLANELIDAFPVHLIERSPAGWTERCVTWAGERFAWELRPITNPELKAFVASLPDTLTVGYRTEVNLEAGKWIRTLSPLFERGWFLLIDYGYDRADYYAPTRSEGTLTCYAHHRKWYDPLQSVGECDITAHVDFTTIIENAGIGRLRLLGKTDQHHFITGAAEARLREIEQIAASCGLDSNLQTEIRAIQTLMHPGTMGRTFIYLLLGKEVSAIPSGFRYARSDPSAG
jgi:SAM-dependent MidA family methyltransferase